MDGHHYKKTNDHPFWTCLVGQKQKSLEASYKDFSKQMRKMFSIFFIFNDFKHHKESYLSYANDY